MSNYRSRLNMFVQKTNISPPPHFEVVNEGLDHAPSFRSTLWICGTCFTSETTFSRRKDADEDVSRIAFEALQARLDHAPVLEVRETWPLKVPSWDKDVAKQRTPGLSRNRTMTRTATTSSSPAVSDSVASLAGTLALDSRVSKLCWEILRCMNYEDDLAVDIMNAMSPTELINFSAALVHLRETCIKKIKERLRLA